MSINKLIEIINSSENIVFFGGAGVSTASNIPDFRSANGLFSQRLNTTVTPEQLVSHSFYLQYPEEFFDFYKSKLIYPEAKPNACHTTLAKLEAMGKLKAIVTQNIDGLHQMAGANQVFELHGSIHRNYCVKCHNFYDAHYILDATGVPRCAKCGGEVKPDVVLYEEHLDDNILLNSVAAITKADTLIIGGTSLVVYPAAGLIDFFSGKHLILINKSATPADHMANLVINDDIASVFAQVMKHL